MNGPESKRTVTATWRAALVGCVTLIILLAWSLWNAQVRQSSRKGPAPVRVLDSITTAADFDPAASGEATIAEVEHAAPTASTEHELATPTEIVGGPGTQPVERMEHSQALVPAARPDEPRETAPSWPPGPWSPAFELAGEPPAFEDVCFGDFDLTKSLPLRDDLLDWFATVPGHAGQLRNVRTQPGESARWEGLLRLQMPWREEVALRLSITDYDALQIHLFHGDTGTTLAYYDREHPRWVAYRTRRTAGSVRPDSYAAAATDEARTRRTRVRHGAPLELRCRPGQVILSHGDIVLLRAPLDAMPTECYFEGRATCYGIRAVRSQWPPESPLERPLAFDTNAPADLAWKEHLGEGSTVVRNPDGTLELSADNARQPAWIACPVPEQGLGEIVMHVEHATPGTGVFLGPSDSRPKHALRLLRDTRSGQTVAVLRDFDTRDTEFPSVQQAFVPWMPESFWVRLLFACGTVHWWISTDGTHWVAGDKQWGNLTDPATHFGLMHRGDLDQGHIRLRRVQFRLLPEFNALADPQLVSRATPWPKASSIAAWLTNTTESAPPGVDPDQWRRASAIRTLSHGCAKALGTQLIELLLEDAARRDMPLERRKALLAEAATLLTVRDDQTEREALLDRYHALGMEAFRRQSQRPYTWIRHDLMSVPLAPHSDVRVAREATIRAEIIQLSHQGRWAELLDLCRNLRVLRQNDVAPLSDWAEAVALRYQPHRGGERIVRRKADWAVTWIEEVSKPTYNFLAELQGMLDSGAWEDAARLISSLDVDLLRGLAPDLRDPRLYLSLPTAVETAVGSAGPLRDVIQRQYHEVAQWRVRSAMERGNPQSLQLATIQFAGTEAAADAHRWLGDRALTGGWFTSALVEYRRGLESAGPVLSADLESRQRLAAALQGQRLDGRAQSDVEFGDDRLNADEFERLIDELVSSRSSDSAAISNVTPPSPPEPTGFRLQRRGQLTGAVGKDASNRAPQNAARYDVDWVGRQLAFCLQDDTLIVSNRFQLSAYRLDDGQRLWQAVPERAVPLAAKDWSLIPMRPLVALDRVYARLLYEPGPILVCVDRSDGQMRWTAELAQNEAVISDPVLIQGQLAALTIARQDQGTNLVRLTVFDTENGHVLTAFDLVRVNDVWWQRRCCETLVIDDSLIVTMSGVTFRCDLSGQIHWLLAQTALPPDEDPRWITQHYQRPWRSGERVYLVQPGVYSVDCLDAKTGSTVWNRVLPDLQRILAVDSDRLIVQTDGDLLALDADTGQTLWEHRLSGMLHGFAGDWQRILFAQPAASRRLARKDGIHLVWLNAETGDAVAATPLSELTAPEACLGPWAVWQDRIWTFYGAGRSEPEPEMIELIPDGDAHMDWDGTAAADPWTRHVPVDLLRAAERRFPGWQVIGGAVERTGPIQAERQGQTNVLVTHAKAGEPVVLTRDVSVPASGQSRLRLTFGHGGVRHWSLEVRMVGQTLHHRETSGRSLREPWQTVEVDLAPVAGRRGALIIEANLIDGGESVELFWDRIEIVH